jgi:hypothetical protein
VKGAALIDNQAKKSGSFIISKADNLRLVSRKSLKIIKEPESDDGSAFIMDEKGFVQIAGPKIFLTPYVSSTSINPQPYIRLDKLADFINEMLSEHESLVNTVTSLSSALSAFGIASTVLLPPAGALATSATLESANLAAQLALLQVTKAKISESLRVNTLASTVIYGE